jgi:hypothetical protein
MLPAADPGGLSRGRNPSGKREGPARRARPGSQAASLDSAWATCRSPSGSVGWSDAGGAPPGWRPRRSRPRGPGMAGLRLRPLRATRSPNLVGPGAPPTGAGPVGPAARPTAAPRAPGPQPRSLARADGDGLRPWCAHRPALPRIIAYRERPRPVRAPDPLPGDVRERGAANTRPGRRCELGRGSVPGRPFQLCAACVSRCRTMTTTPHAVAKHVPLAFLAPEGQRRPCPRSGPRVNRRHPS